MSSINQKVLLYQEIITREESKKKVLLHYLRKLTQLPIEIEHLQATGVGKTISRLKNIEGRVGKEATILVKKWKTMVRSLSPPTEHSLNYSTTQHINNNIDDLENVKGVPYKLLRPVLLKANAKQLIHLEIINPYLLKHTNEMWRLLCQKEFKNVGRQEIETWKDVYLRCQQDDEESENKLTPRVQTTDDEFVAGILRNVSKPGQQKEQKCAYSLLTNISTSAEVSQNYNAIDVEMPSDSRVGAVTKQNKKPLWKKSIKDRNKLIKHGYGL